MKKCKISFHATDSKVIVQILFDEKTKQYTVFDSVNIDTFKTDSFDKALSQAVHMWSSSAMSYEDLQKELKALEDSKIGIIDNGGNKNAN